MSDQQAQFAVGQVIRHARFGYFGVIYDVDAEFAGSDAWYEQVARSRPPKDRPWYHVLPHGSEHTTYVAERNLTDAAEGNGEPVPGRIEHPMLDALFSGFADGRYVRRAVN